jgi:hypothetical protein
MRESLTADESDRLSQARETTTERLVVWTRMDLSCGRETRTGSAGLNPG